MKRILLFISLVLYITSVYSSAKWEDCGIPLTRKIYYQGVVVSPSTIDISSQSADHSISVNVNSQIKDYTVISGTTINLEVIKDGETYFDGPVGDLCQILKKANGVDCPLVSGPYSFPYQYTLPPLPTGNYSITIKTYEPVTGNQIGCLSVQTFIVGLGVDQCSYDSTLSAVLSGTARYLNDNTVIQIGPWGPNGLDLGYPWGTFNRLTASADLVGYTFKPDNYVWGLTGSLNKTVDPTKFDGTIVLGVRPDVNDYQYAKLVYQGTFSWIMTPTDDPMKPPYIFESGTFDFHPAYFFPTDYPYPLNLGNLGTLSISQDEQKTTFKISTTRKWCRCNCDLGGVGKDPTVGGNTGNSGSGMSGFKKGTIAICVIGGLILIVAIIVIVKIRRSKPRPVVYDDADLMDPQKPDYGTIAINEAFEAEEQEYN